MKTLLVHISTVFLLVAAGNAQGISFEDYQSLQRQYMQLCGNRSTNDGSRMGQRCTKWRRQLRRLEQQLRSNPYQNEFYQPGGVQGSYSACIDRFTRRDCLSVRRLGSQAWAGRTYYEFRVNNACDQAVLMTYALGGEATQYRHYASPHHSETLRCDARYCNGDFYILQQSCR